MMMKCVKDVKAKTSNSISHVNYVGAMMNAWLFLALAISFEVAGTLRCEVNLRSFGAIE